MAVSDLSVFPNHSSSPSFRLICCLTNFWGAVAETKNRRSSPPPPSLSLPSVDIDGRTALTPHPIRAKKWGGGRDAITHERRKLKPIILRRERWFWRELLELGGATVMYLFYGEAPSPQSPPISRRRNPLIFRDGDSSRERRRRR